ncbi:GNAT family N-acetyltransferase [Paenibacillus piscarius]|uniref:GNAT family N-acetyltransferase n=1 Tax=Paenibacillus piscarius TaxID=1089681 RepID=UPI001EE8660C|nr:GNAT family N-acetyltransferase [Paenibacillus piscarius]
MIWLEPVPDALTPQSLEIQASILNSQPEFNLMVLHKAYVEPSELEEENRNNLAMGEKMLYIRSHDRIAGLITYLPDYSADHYPWIGLLVIHRQYSRQGIGIAAIHELEQMFRTQGLGAVRLAVQLENKAGEAFWTRNGFTPVRRAADNHNNEVDVYEKQFK